MPSLIFVVLLAILFKAIPGTVFIPVFFAAIVAFPLSQATLSFARANHLEGNWAIGIELGIITFIIIVIATFFAWKIWSAPARRRLYLNLLILTVGIPVAIVFGVATTRLYS